MAAIPRTRPKFMVIGDSLAQGCRSLSVKADYCAQSWGARIAAAQKWEFTGQFTHAPAGPLTNDSNLADVLRVMKAAFQP